MNRLLVIFCFFFSVTSVLAKTTIEVAPAVHSDSLYKVVSFDSFDKLFYASETPDLKVTFGKHKDYEIWYDGKKTEFVSNTSIILKNIEIGDHSLTLKRK